MKRFRWRWRLWRAKHYEWKAYVELAQGRGGHGAWDRAKQRVEEVRASHP